MASSVYCRARAYSPIFSSSTIRRRLPLVGAFCVLSFGLSNLYPSISAPSLLSKFRSKALSGSSSSFSSVRMESGSTTVPSIVVYVTVPSRDEGKKLAESLVRAKLAACVNRVPGIESVYEWQGEVQTDAEELLIIKTRQSLLEALTEHVKNNHLYDVPEIISLPITGGSVPYLEWIKNSTRE